MNQLTCRWLMAMQVERSYTQAYALVQCQLMYVVGVNDGIWHADENRKGHNNEWKMPPRKRENYKNSSDFQWQWQCINDTRTVSIKRLFCIWIYHQRIIQSSPDNDISITMSSCRIEQSAPCSQAIMKTTSRTLNHFCRQIQQQVNVLIITQYF